jgi:hypothetical protein
MMTKDNPGQVGPTEEQLCYANLLNKGMLIGLITLIITFIIYVLSILPPVIPKKEVSIYWTHSLHDYLHETGIKAGWNWMTQLGKGDMLNFAPIAFLGAVTIFCFLAIVPIFLRKKDIVYTLLALLEVAVLAIAASGILGVGGH